MLWVYGSHGAGCRHAHGRARVVVSVGHQPVAHVFGGASHGGDGDGAQPVVGVGAHRRQHRVEHTGVVAADPRGCLRPNHRVGVTDEPQEHGRFPTKLSDRICRREANLGMGVGQQRRHFGKQGGLPDGDDRAEGCLPHFGIGIAQCQPQCFALEDSGNRSSISTAIRRTRGS